MPEPTFKDQLPGPAPYRFVPLPRQVVPAPVDWEALSHGRPLAGGLCADIAVTWTAETPLLVGTQDVRQDGPAVPFRLGETGSYAIPGSTLRGLLRGVVEIASFGRLTQVNAHHRYGFRDFNHPWYRKQLSETTDRDRIKAGWLSQDSAGGYWITPCEWSRVPIDDIARRCGLNAVSWLELKLLKKYELLGRTSGGKSPMVDFQKPQRFTATGEARVWRPDDRGAQEGFLVAAGAQRQRREGGQVVPSKFARKWEYVFHAPTGAEPERIQLNDAAFKAFELIHTKPAKNRRLADGSWKDLERTLKPGDGRVGRIPVFYVGDLAAQAAADCDDEAVRGFHMGLTRLFKLPHMKSVGELIQGNHKQHRNWPAADRPDLAEALFGWVWEDDERPANLTAGTVDTKAMKGRISAGFARCATPPEHLVEEAARDCVMMGPRGSFWPYYLEGGDRDYSDADAKLRGRKRYPVRHPAVEPAAAWTALDGALHRSLVEDNKDVVSQVRYLHPRPGHALTFEGVLRLHNVMPAELGAVLWALSFGGQRDGRLRHAMGRGKAFGAGQMRAEVTGLRVVPNVGEVAEVAEEKPYLDAFERHMNAAVPGWIKTETIQRLLDFADPKWGEARAKEGRLAYLADERGQNGHQAHSRLKADMAKRRNRPEAGARTGSAPSTRPEAAPGAAATPARTLNISEQQRRLAALQAAMKLPKK